MIDSNLVFVLFFIYFICLFASHSIHDWLDWFRVLYHALSTSHSFPNSGIIPLSPYSIRSHGRIWQDNQTLMREFPFGWISKLKFLLFAHSNFNGDSIRSLLYFWIRIRFRTIVSKKRDPSNRREREGERGERGERIYNQWVEVDLLNQGLSWVRIAVANV